MAKSNYEHLTDRIESLNKSIQHMSYQVQDLNESIDQCVELAEQLEADRRLMDENEGWDYCQECGKVAELSPVVQPKHPTWGPDLICKSCADRWASHAANEARFFDAKAIMAAAASKEA